jgi:diphosphomevalonate decarboxylase
MKKATAIAPSNVGLIKYWGKKDETLRLPENGSFSMNLSNLTTTTTVEFSPLLKDDEIAINGESREDELAAVRKHLTRLRKNFGESAFARVVSKNNFPIGRGLSSSASGFAALTLAVTTSLEQTLSEKMLSILARQGSGSACRSIPDGFVEWKNGDTSDSSYAESIFPSDYWDIYDIVAVVGVGKKEVSTTNGMLLHGTSPFFPTRLSRMAQKIVAIKQYIKDKNFEKFGELIEAEALEMHAVMLTSSPALIYWTSGTLELMKQAQKWRQNGIGVYFTINTGQDIHLITQKNAKDALLQELKKYSFVKEIIVNTASKGAKISENHLF